MARLVMLVAEQVEDGSASSGIPAVLFSIDSQKGASIYTRDTVNSLLMID